jgi:hypothetical protein
MSAVFAHEIEEAKGHKVTAAARRNEHGSRSVLAKRNATVDLETAHENRPAGMQEQLRNLRRTRRASISVIMFTPGAVSRPKTPGGGPRGPQAKCALLNSQAFFDSLHSCDSLAELCRICSDPSVDLSVALGRHYNGRMNQNGPDMLLCSIELFGLESSGLQFGVSRNPYLQS